MSWPSLKTIYECISLSLSAGLSLKVFNLNCGCMLTILGFESRLKAFVKKDLDAYIFGVFLSKDLAIAVLGY